LKKIYWPISALASGFGLAFLAAGMSSYFFVLLPILAFVFGYYSSWRWGLLSGFLLFAGYTFTLSLIWNGIESPNLSYPLPYIFAFLGGGFSLLIIGALAPSVRNGIKRACSVTALAILTIVAGWCGYTAVPHYSYYYQVVIQSPENLKNLELYLPAGTVSDEPYTRLYGKVLTMSGDLTENFTPEIVDTEQGRMLKITIPALKKEHVPEPRYTANIIFSQGRAFWQKIVPFQLIQLKPKSDVFQTETLISQRFVGPVKSDESKVLERFNVPVKVCADAPARIRLTLWNRTDREEALNFTYTYCKSVPYTEQINYEVPANGEWRYLPVQATSRMEIKGISD
jgi:hypothetical protein